MLGHWLLILMVVVSKTCMWADQGWRTSSTRGTVLHFRIDVLCVAPRWTLRHPRRLLLVLLLHQLLYGHCRGLLHPAYHLSGPQQC